MEPATRVQDTRTAVAFSGSTVTTGTLPSPIGGGVEEGRIEDTVCDGDTGGLNESGAPEVKGVLEEEEVSENKDVSDEKSFLEDKEVT